MKKTIQRELKLTASDTTDTATLDSKMEYRGCAPSLSPTGKLILFILTRMRKIYIKN